MDINLSGLSDEQVRQSINRYGKNELTEKKKTTFISSFLKNLGDPIIKILLVALVITLLMPKSGGGFFEAAGIAVSIVVSTMVSTLSELGSERAFRKMQREAENQICTVIRNGIERKVSVSEIVVGDLVRLRAGDKVPADGFIVSGTVSCDQSALNGESKEVTKSQGSGFSGELRDISSVFRGSTVASGNAVMQVSQIGDNSYYGKVASELQETGEESPLKKKLSVLAGTLSKFGYFCAICVAGAELIYAFVIDKSFVFSAQSVAFELLHALTLAVSVVVVAVPEGLPMMISIVLSSNMVKMQKHSVQVRHPVGIESAGCVNILFTDKTGTLTYGRPRVVTYVTGELEKASRVSDLSEDINFLTSACAVMSSDCTVRMGRNFAADGGNATDRAVIESCISGNAYPKGIMRSALLPFDSRRKFSCASAEIKGYPELSSKFGRKTVFVKGAPEVLLEKCKKYYKNDGSVSDINREKLKSELEGMMKKGMRVIAMATSGASEASVAKMGELAGENKEFDISPIFCDMTFICFVGVRDEVRREAPKAVKTLKNAGVNVVMITGDSALTAESVAKECGIIEKTDKNPYRVMESKDIAALSDEQLADRIYDIKVVARALPQDKSRLVRIAKSLGLVTGMTGDGLNDAPALKQADVGFAMGSGTDVAKEAGDIIITDDNISSIVRAVLYGRTVFKSIRKFVVFQLTMNLCAVGISIIGPFIGCESPVTVAQMLWINLIMDTLAALAFAGEAPMKRYLKEKPLPMTEAVLSGNMITRIFVMGVYTVLLCLFFHKSSYVRSMFPLTEGDTLFLSGFFALFVFCGIFGAFNARSPRLNIFSGLFENPMFLFVMSAVSTVQLGMIYYGGELFRCMPLSASQLKLAILLAFSVIPAGRVLALVMGKRTD